MKWIGRVFFLPFLVFTAGTPKDVVWGGSSDVILWPETPLYSEKVRTLVLSPTEARALLVQNIKQRPDRFVDRSPIFLIGDQYFFAEPRKAEIRLDGFYVDGLTGRIEYRKSSKTVQYGCSVLPEDAFEASELLRRGGPKN